jgi:hypothetical protein
MFKSELGFYAYNIAKNALPSDGFD